jgi:hypothetical protein
VGNGAGAKGTDGVRGGLLFLGDFDFVGHCKVDDSGGDLIGCG